MADAKKQKTNKGYLYDSIENYCFSKEREYCKKAKINQGVFWLFF